MEAESLIILKVASLRSLEFDAIESNMRLAITLLNGRAGSRGIVANSHSHILCSYDFMDVYYCHSSIAQRLEKSLENAIILASTEASG